LRLSFNSRISLCAVKTRQEFAGRELDEPHWKKHYSDLVGHRPFRNFAYSTTMADGSIRYLEISGKPVFNSDGEFAGYRSVPAAMSPS
jgi:hypothetical protein